MNILNMEVKEQFDPPETDRLCLFIFVTFEDNETKFLSIEKPFDNKALAAGLRLLATVVDEYGH